MEPRHPKKRKERNDNQFYRVIEAIDKLETEEERHIEAQLDEKTCAITRAAKTSGRPATLTVKLTAKPGPERRVIYFVTHTASLPTPASGSVTAYADEDGVMHSRDPMQIDLPNMIAGALAPKERPKAHPVETPVDPPEDEGEED